MSRYRPVEAPLAHVDPFGASAGAGAGADETLRLRGVPLDVGPGTADLVLRSTPGQP